jgi:cob(I)alamin adenosyltransferase
MTPKIYTRRGDDGYTVLDGLDRVPKTLSRLGAVGDVEEANAAIGAAIATGSMPHEFDVLLRDVQNDLLDVAADLSVPRSGEERNVVRVGSFYVDRLEGACDRYSAGEPTRGFAMFGGLNDAAGLLCLARTVARRAERSVWSLVSEDPHATGAVPAVYLNRVADLLLVVALQVESAERRNVPLGACSGLPVADPLPDSAVWVPGREWTYGPVRVSSSGTG